MFNKLYVCFGLPEKAKSPRPAVPLEDYVQNLSAVFHKALAESPPGLQVVVQLPSEQPITLVWLASGTTAGVGFWLRDQSLQAATIVMSALDRDEDLHALEIVAQTTGLALPSVARQAAEQVAEPMVINVFCVPSALSDPVIATVSASLANARFALLGVEEPEEGGLIV